MTPSARLVAVAALLLVSGCLFGGKATPIEIRYFSPELAPSVVAPLPARPGGGVRLGAIDASAHLSYRIVHRSSAVERQLYDTLRWTERPDTYVRRSLSRALYIERGLDHARDPTLEIEVLAFEQAERDGHPVGRVELAYELVADSRVIASGAVTEERAAAGTNIEAVVVAIGTAMDAATATVADRVTAVLRSR